MVKAIDEKLQNKPKDTDDENKEKINKIFEKKQIGRPANGNNTMT